MNLQNLSSSCLYFIGILLKLTTGKTRCFRLFMFDVFPLCTEALRVRLSPMYADCRVHEGESEMSTLFIPLFYFPLISPKRDRDRFAPLKRFYVVFAFCHLLRYVCRYIYSGSRSGQPLNNTAPSLVVLS